MNPAHATVAWTLALAVVGGLAACTPAAPVTGTKPPPSRHPAEMPIDAPVPSPAPAPSAPRAPEAAAAPRPSPPRVLRIAPSRPPADTLVVFAHGLGANADDLEPIARGWSRALPSAEFLCPDAFHPYDGAPYGRQWFAFGGVTDANRPERVRAAALELSAWLDAELDARGLGRERLVLAGFSQGAMLASWLAVHRTPRPLAVVAFSGRLADADPPEPVKPAPVFVSHGTADGVIPVAHGQAAAEALRALGAEVEVQIERGLGHGISPDLERRALAFVTRHVAPTRP